MAEDQNVVQLDNALVKQLVTSVQTLQSEVAALKSGATGGSNLTQPPPGAATLSQTDSVASGNGTDPPAKRQRSDDGGDSEEEPPSSDEDDDNVFTLSEAGNAFMETAFKSKLNTASRKKKMAKLGLPNCKWTKPPELDSFIASTIPKDVVRSDNAAHKTQRLWLEAASLLAAVVDKTDGGEVSEAEMIQGIRNALLLLGNASQQHSLQRRKAILQHLNPQLKSLVQDTDFAEAPPYLFGTKFGELAKERLEAAALIQKAKPQNFQKRHPQKFNSWGRQGGNRTSNRGSNRGRIYHGGGSRSNTSNPNNRS